MKRFKKIVLWVFGIFLAVLVLLTGGFFIFVSSYYHADSTAAGLTENSGVYSLSSNLTVLKPENPNGTGLIFYPGGKVEHTAYLPLLDQLRKEGYTCVLVKMPFHLAVFDADAADKIYDQFPDIKHWYLGGHSLGGAMASDYFSRNQDKLEGLILLGAYIYGDADPARVLILYGSKDTVLDRSKITKTPNVHEIAGGNHAQFGNYGEQKGDGIATISREEQQRTAVEYISAFMDENRQGVKTF